MNTHPNFRVIAVNVFVALVLVINLSGCGLLNASLEQQQGKKIGVLVGTVYAPANAKGAIVVSAFQPGTGSGATDHYVILDSSGGFELVLDTGHYQLVAFVDANNNLQLDEGEASGVLEQEIALEPRKVMTGLDIFIKDAPPPNPLRLGYRLPPKQFSHYRATNAGAIADLDEQGFSAEFASEKGYWEALRFFQEMGGNIFFLETFDPKRIPVLLIHGSRGGPQDWRYVIEHLDKSKYQAWVYYYPTGPSMGDLSNLLNVKLLELQSKYHFPRMHVLAHSAGGLLARDFLARYGDAHPYIDSFISISTPWGGEAMAESGVKYSPVVLPSWVEMQPNGPFIHSLFAKPLPTNITYHLLFGFRGSASLVRPNTDGTVTLASILDGRAQKEARSMAAFDEDHVGVLASQAVVERIAVTLRQADSVFLSSPKGDLKVRTRGLKQEEIAKGRLEISLTDQAGRIRKFPFFPETDTTLIHSLPVGEYRFRANGNTSSSDDELVIQIIERTPAEVEIQIESGIKTLCLVGAETLPSTSMLHHHQGHEASETSGENPSFPQKYCGSKALISRKSDKYQGTGTTRITGL